MSASYVKGRNYYPRLSSSSVSTNEDSKAASSELSNVDDQVASTFEEQPPSQFHVPSVRQILQFAIPAIGVWLCSPLLSMIDTSVVGLFSGTTQQAALSPAVAVTDYSARTLVRVNKRTPHTASPNSARAVLR